MFESVTNDVESVSIRTNTEAIDELEYLVKTIRHSVPWEQQVEAIRRGMGVIKGGIMRFDSFRSGVRRFGPGLRDAVIDLRARLVKEACLFITQIAVATASDIDLFGDFIRPLSKQLPHGTQIISDSCACAILAIVKHCPTPSVMKAVHDLAREGGAKQKTVMAEMLSVVTQVWPVRLLETNADLMRDTLTALVAEASPVTRTFARRAVKTMIRVVPVLRDRWLSNLPAHTREAIDEEEDPPQTARLKFREPIGQQTERKRVQFAGEVDVGMKTKMGEERVELEAKENERVAAKIRAVAEGVFRGKEPLKEEEQEPDSGRVVLCGMKLPRGVKLRKAKPWYKPYKYEKPGKVKDGVFLDRNAPPDVSVEDSKHIPKDEKQALIKRLKKNKVTWKKWRAQPAEQQQKPQHDEPVVGQTPSPNKGGGFLDRNGPTETSLQDSKHVVDKGATKLKMERQNEIDKNRRNTERKERRMNEKLQKDKSANAARYRQENKSPPRVKSPAKRKQEPVHKITLVEGREFDYLDDLREVLAEHDQHYLNKNGAKIAADMSACISHNSVQIASAAIQMLPNLIQACAKGFSGVLATYIEVLLGLVENGNPRLAGHALFTLNELPKYFETIAMIKVCYNLAPSFPLLHFTNSLVEMASDDAFTDITVRKLCHLGLRSYDMMEVKSRHLSAHIIKRCNSVNHRAVCAFGNALPDAQLRDFEQFIQCYIPDLTFRNVSVNVPPFNVKGASLWRSRIAQIADNLSATEWQLTRSMIFSELNSALMSGRDIDPTLRVIQSILSFRGCDEFEPLLPGLITVSCDDSSKIVDSIFLSIMRSSPVYDLLQSFQPLIAGDDVSLTMRSLDIQSRIIATLTDVDLSSCVPMLVSSLKTAFHSIAPEVRRSTVLCFVELYRILGSDIMDSYITCLSTRQQELVLLYCAKYQLV